MAGREDPETVTSRQNFAGPYTSHHPVPTVQGYREGTHSDSNGDGRVQQALDSAKHYWYSDEATQNDSPEIYNSEDRNAHGGTAKEAVDGNKKAYEENGQGPSPNNQNTENHAESMETETDPRQKRKDMKHMKRDHGQREVTDPVTHLPVTIHDSTNRELEHIPGNLPPAGSEPHSSTGVRAMKKSRAQLHKETEESEKAHSGMTSMFPPPRFETTRRELVQLNQLALSVGLCVMLFVVVLVVAIRSLMGRILASVVGLCLGLPLIWGLRSWVGKKVDRIWQDEVWDAKREQANQEVASSSTPESTHWLNSLLASVWPLVNPDLFTSLADTLEVGGQSKPDSSPKIMILITLHYARM